MDFLTQEEKDILGDVADEVTVLIVDDDRLVLAALENLLRMDGCRIITAHSGYEALEILGKESVGVIICDQRMPGIEGVEVLQKAVALQPHAIRMLITANCDEKVAVQAINQGHVHDLISKPWDDQLVKETVAHRISQFNLLRQNRNLQKMLVEKHKALSQSHESLRRDLKLGSVIHETLLTGDIPQDIEGITIKASTIPSQEIDGDFFDFYRPAEGVFDLVIGDVMGKGIPAAVVATAVKTQIIPFANPLSKRQIFDRMRAWKNDLFEPEEIIAMVHRELSHKLIRLEYFVSLFYARFNLHAKTLKYVDCGFAKPIHYSAKTGELRLLKGDNFPLGIVEKHYSIQSQEISFEENDFFIFYSDGVTEGMSPTNELFGINRLMDLVRSHLHFSPTDLLDEIKSQVLKHLEKPNFSDDVTIIIVKIHDDFSSKVSSFVQADFRSDLSQLKAVRDYISRFCKNNCGHREVYVDELQLAINEAFCNIVKHGFIGNQKGKIQIKASADNQGIILELSDQGPAFNPETIQEPSLAGDRDDGFGWHIIRNVADKVVYIKKTSDHGWNHLRIYKYYVNRGGRMELSFRNEGELLLIMLQSECLDAKDAPEFKQKVIDMIMANHSQRVVIDLGPLKFIDSSGLGSFLAVLRTINSRGGELRLTSMSRAVKAMFELVSMHKIFDIYPTLEEARQSFTSVKPH